MSPNWTIPAKTIHPVIPPMAVGLDPKGIPIFDKLLPESKPLQQSLG